MNDHSTRKGQRAAENTSTTRRAPLVMDPDSFRQAGYRLVDRVADLLATLPQRPVTPAESPAAVRRALHADAPLPEAGMDAADLLEDACELLFEHSLFNGHPRFFGYVTSAPSPIGMFGDFLAAAVNANVGAWRLAPMATEMEAQTVRWMAQLLGYPDDCGGLLVSGGNVANAVGLLAARTKAADWNVRRDGGVGSSGRRMRVYASTETHTWLEKAADLSGIGTGAIRWIPAGTDGRMEVTALREALHDDRTADLVPMAVVASAGTVGTGAVDPLQEIADLCEEGDLWLHVDGAYGAFAAAVPGTPADLQELARAHSVAIDPHKWLYAPLEAGCVLVKDADLLAQTFSYHPPYYHFGEETLNYYDLGPQNSRGFRALKVWLALRQVGRGGCRQMIGEDMRLSKHLFSLVSSHRDLEPCTQSLSIATFRFVPSDLGPRVGEPAVADYLNELNEAVLERLQLSGEAFVSNAVVDGRYVLRACIVNFNTTFADVEALPKIVVRLGRDVDASLRGGSTGQKGP